MAKQLDQTEDENIELLKMISHLRDQLPDVEKYISPPESKESKP